jgi:putative ABC transport system substrate-binding protein
MNTFRQLKINLRWQAGYCVILVAIIFYLPLHAGETVTARRIGYLTPDTAALHAPNAAAFEKGLRERGYIVGQNITIERRFAENDPSRFENLAKELVRLQVEILVVEATQAALAAKRATNTIPIVVAVSSDLVSAGLAASLARPGGNVTGSVIMSPELVGKRLALLREVAPRAHRIAVLANPDNPASGMQVKAAETAAPALGLAVHPVTVRQVSELDRAFSSLAGRFDALLVTDDPLLDAQRTRIMMLAGKKKLASICGYPVPGDTDCLIEYGPDLSSLYQRAARFVDLILKGAKPADLPIEQPTTFRLTVNLNAAKALGQPIPQSVLGRADQIIR